MSDELLRLWYDGNASNFILLLSTSGKNRIFLRFTITSHKLGIRLLRLQLRLQNRAHLGENCEVAFGNATELNCEEVETDRLRRGPQRPHCKEGEEGPNRKNLSIRPEILPRTFSLTLLLAHFFPCVISRFSLLFAHNAFCHAFLRPYFFFTIFLGLCGP